MHCSVCATSPNSWYSNCKMIASIYFAIVNENNFFEFGVVCGD